MNEYTEKYRKLSPEEKFEFSCHKGLPCFNTCCCDINIFLTPYDVLRLRKSAGLSSQEFLHRYSIPLIGDAGLPVVMLKMMDDEKKSCPFVTPEGCKIYEDRPWSCRMYPLFPASSKEEGFLIEEKPSCLGFKEGGKQWTIEDWRKDQGIDIYDEMNKSYKEITFHDYFQSGNKLNLGEVKIFYMACYDLDNFRRFLFETRFFNIFDVDTETIKRIKDDEQELLSFGFKYLKFSLFWEDTLRLKDKTLDKLRQSRRKELGLY